MIRIDGALSSKLSNMGLLCACLIVTLHISLAKTGCWLSRLLTGSGLGNIAAPFFFVSSGIFMFVFAAMPPLIGLNGFRWCFVILWEEGWYNGNKCFELR